MEKYRPFFERFKCEFCHKTATHYVTYKEFHSYLCNSQDCELKFKIRSEIFDGLDVEQK
jgi:hypothetical protein